MAKQEEIKTEFVNPFAPGVTYDEFTKALDGKTAAEYCKGQLTEDQIMWLDADLIHYYNNKKNK